MTEHFCTYFDHRYAPKGLAMWRSLKARRPSAVLHVLCLNEPCLEILSSLELRDVHLHSLSALESAEPGLVRARGNRTLVEYYFTLTPCLPLHVFRTHPGVLRVTYVDADLFFFADPQPVFDEISDCAIGLIEHRFPEHRIAELTPYGRFNVGWLTFRNDPTSVACLTTWREQCLEWCYDRVEPGRFAEQKYLDQWPDRFRSVRIIQHKGANVAPWNLDRFKLATRGGKLTVGGERILFFHAHGFQPKSPGRDRVLNLEPYRVQERPLLFRCIFDPYEKALTDATSEIAIPLALALQSDQTRNGVPIVETLKAQASSAQAQLSASEKDRAARLDEILRLQRELDQSLADRTTQGGEIQRLQQALETSQADGAARLEVIRALEAQLMAGEAGRQAQSVEIQRLQNALDVTQADSAARLEQIRGLYKEIDADRAEHAAGADVIRGLEQNLLEAVTDHAALCEQLVNSEADHATRLEVIHTLQEQLEASRATCAAHLYVMERIQRQLRESSDERDAALDAVHALQARLETSETDRATQRARATDAESESHARLEALNSARAHAESIASDLELTRQQLVAERARIATLESSRVWRWSKALRSAANFFGVARLPR